MCVCVCVCVCMYVCMHVFFKAIYDNKLENSERDGNNRLPDLPLEKPICRSVLTVVRTGHGTTDWFQIGKGVTSRLYIITLLI